MLSRKKERRGDPSETDPEAPTNGSRWAPKPTGAREKEPSRLSLSRRCGGCLAPLLAQSRANIVVLMAGRSSANSAFPYDATTASGPAAMARDAPVEELAALHRELDALVLQTSKNLPKDFPPPPERGAAATGSRV